MLYFIRKPFSFNLLKISLIWWAVALCAAGCSNDDEPANNAVISSDGGSGIDLGFDMGIEEVTPEVDFSDEVYDSSRLMEVEITMDPEDWDSLRMQTREWLMFMDEDCQEEPFDNPYTYFPATVSIDGEVFSEIGVRKKGFLGSLSDIRPSLKIKLDEYVDGQHYLGLDRLTLNNSNQDPSAIRQCLAYQFFADAGLPAPRCSFAHVVVNGQDLGVYANVEPIKDPFLLRHFSSDEGNLYEGTVSDFREGWTGTFEKKNNDGADDWSDVEAMVAAFQVEDALLLETVAPLLDIEAFINFWASEVVMTHWDGYAGNANNFYFYDDPESDQIHFIPWGADAVLIDDIFGEEEAGTTIAVMANNIITSRFYALPETRDMYLSRLRELIETVWDTEAILAEIDRMEALISPYAEVNSEKPIADAIEDVRQMVSTHQEELLAVLDAGTPEWDVVELDDSICMSHEGSITVEFETTWGTLEAEEPWTVGTVSMVYVKEGVETFFEAGATAGLSTDETTGETFATLIFAGWSDDGYLLYVYNGFPEAGIESGETLIADFDAFFSVLGYMSAETGWQPVDAGWLLGAELVFDEGAPVEGETLSGHFYTDIYAW